MKPARLICLVLAIVCFLLAAFNVPKAKWDSLGFAFVTLSLLV